MTSAAEMNFDLLNPHARSQTPSIISLQIPQYSVPVTAATSMLTIVPAEDEKSQTHAGPSGEGQGPYQGSDDPLSVTVPQVALTFLLVSGSRRTMMFDPETAVGRVKELVWSAWPGDWQDEKPPAPNFLRILHLGKILQDEDTLSKLSFPASTTSPPPSPTSPSPSTAHPPTIVHLSIRPYVPPTEDEASLKKNLRAARRALSRSASNAPGAEAGGAEDGADAGRCCGCVIC